MEKILKVTLKCIKYDLSAFVTVDQLLKLVKFFFMWFGLYFPVPCISLHEINNNKFLGKDRQLELRFQFTILDLDSIQCALNNRVQKLKIHDSDDLTKFRFSLGCLCQPQQNLLNCSRGRHCLFFESKSHTNIPGMS